MLRAEIFSCIHTKNICLKEHVKAPGVLGFSIPWESAHWLELSHRSFHSPMHLAESFAPRRGWLPASCLNSTPNLSKWISSLQVPARSCWRNPPHFPLGELTCHNSNHFHYCYLRINPHNLCKIRQSTRRKGMKERTAGGWKSSRRDLRINLSLPPHPPNVAWL